MPETLRKVFRVFERAVLALTGFLGAASALVIALISVVSTYNVVQRLTFGHSIHGIVDLSALALVVIAFGGIAQAELTETHVRMSLFADRAGPKMRKSILLFAQFTIGSLAVVMLQASFERAMASYAVNETQAAQTFMPVWPIRFFIVIGLLALLAVCIVKFVRILSSDSDTGAEEINSGEEVLHG